MTRLDPAARHRLLAGVKAVHTGAFLVIVGAIATIVVDGLRGRPTRRTATATAIALTECAVFAANGFVCPLTPLAEELGAERGSVTDIFLPDWLARNLTWISTPILVLGLALNLRAVGRRGPLRSASRPRARPARARSTRSR